MPAWSPLNAAVGADFTSIEMTKEPPSIYRDGILSLIGGMDSGRNTSLLTPVQAALIVNMMVRGGFAETRYGYKQRALRFENDEQEDWYNTHLFQGGDFFAPTEATPMLIASVGGRIFKIDVLDSYQVTEITPVRGTATDGAFISPAIGSSVTVGVTDNSTIHVGYPLTIGSGRYMVTAKGFANITITNLDAIAGVNVATGTPVYYLHSNPSLLPRIWTLQAENYFIIQNGSDAAIIYDGATARRSVRTGSKLEVPTGTSMAYWQGRIWVAVNGKEIEAGDIHGGPTSIIDFTETTYLNEGGRFRVPSGAGNITALRVLPVLDASLGQGPLQVHTKTSVSTLNLPVTRDRWKDVDQPVQPMVGLGYGAQSDWSTIPVNTDMFLRATDGLRSFRMARQEQSGSWGNTPISREMQRILQDDDQSFLQYGSATLFDNLLLFTVNPLPFNSGRAAYWQGLGVLDFDLISSMGQKSPPVYAGVWNGVNVMQIIKGTFKGKERCFLFVRNADFENDLWEVDPQSRFDNDCGRIEWVIESRAMDFGHPLSLHELQNAELWVDQIEGKVNIDLEFRRDQDHCWRDWPPTKELCAKSVQCETPEGECFNFPTFRTGFRTRQSWNQPPNTCEEFDNKPARLGYSHEIRIKGAGHARVKALLVKAIAKTEIPFASGA